MPSYTCWSVGRFREALRFAEQACELNPLMPAARLHAAQMRTYVGDYQTSIRMHQERDRRLPRNFTILITLLNFSCSLDFWDAYNQAVDAIQYFDGRQAQHPRAPSTADALGLRSAASTSATLPGLVAKTGTLPLNYLDGHPPSPTRP